MEKETILKRLAFIKYLFSQADNQASLPEPINSSSVLMFHDAIELFLLLVAEYTNVKVNDVKFIEYWTNINPTLQSIGKQELTQKESMRRFNKMRGNLKHHGIFPSQSDIKEFKVISNVFFEENCKTLFDMDIKDISLIELVSYQKTKEHLINSDKSFKDSNFLESVKHLALAFELLIRDYELSKRNRFGQSPFFFGRDITFLGSFHMNLERGNKLSEFVDKVKESIESMQKAVKILSFGIDYRKFVKFSMLTPQVIWVMSGEPLVSISNNAKISKEEFEHCFNFIIESALKLQEFDFAVSNVPQ